MARPRAKPGDAKHRYTPKGDTRFFAAVVAYLTTKGWGVAVSGPVRVVKRSTSEHGYTLEVDFYGRKVEDEPT